jgi:type IV pilus assembly protein PilE
MKKVRGFTLIELMIVLAVAVVLATVAVSAYSKQARRSHRYDAAAAIAKVHVAQQKYRINHATYAADYATLGDTTLSESPGKYYDITMVVPPAAGTCTSGTRSNFNSYQITATTKGSQTPDTGCATFVLTNLCGVITKTSTGGDTCWPN